MIDFLFSDLSSMIMVAVGVCGIGVIGVAEALLLEGDCDE